MSSATRKLSDRYGGGTGGNIKTNATEEGSKCSLDHSEGEDFSDSDPSSNVVNSSSDATREPQGVEDAAKECETSKLDKQRRLAMNRDAARARRKRKREFIEDLQETVGKLTRENDELKQTKKLLRSKIEQFSGLVRNELGSGTHVQLPIPFAISSLAPVSQPIIPANLLQVSSGQQIPVLPQNLVQRALALNLQSGREQGLPYVTNIGLPGANIGAVADTNAGADTSVTGAEVSVEKKKASK